VSVVVDDLDCTGGTLSQRLNYYQARSKHKKCSDYLTLARSPWWKPEKVRDSDLPWFLVWVR